MDTANNHVLQNCPSLFKHVQKCLKFRNSILLWKSRYITVATKASQREPHRSTSQPVCIIIVSKSASYCTISSGLGLHTSPTSFIICFTQAKNANCKPPRLHDSLDASLCGPNMFLLSTFISDALNIL